MILRVVDLSPTLSPTRNIPLITKERTLESPDDSLILRDVPSSSAMILHGTLLLSPILRWNLDGNMYFPELAPCRITFTIHIYLTFAGTGHMFKQLVLIGY
jgi:hypothetical protein